MLLKLERIMVWYRAELVVRKLERVWVEQQTLLDQKLQRQALKRTISCYQRGYLLVDCTPAGLLVIHMNTAACEELSESLFLSAAKCVCEEGAL